MSISNSTIIKQNSHGIIRPKTSSAGKMDTFFNDFHGRVATLKIQRPEIGHCAAREQHYRKLLQPVPLKLQPYGDIQICLL